MIGRQIGEWIGVVNYDVWEFGRCVVGALIIRDEDLTVENGVDFDSGR